MNLAQKIMHTFVPEAAQAEKCFQKACALTDDLTAMVRSRKFPDPFSPIVHDMRRHRMVSEYDQQQAADIYEKKVP